MDSPDDRLDTAKLAIRLLVSVHRLRSRLREEAGITSSGFTLTQLTLLYRLVTAGPATAASLAAEQHVSQQAIAQNLAPLKSAGLIAAAGHPTDRRKVLVDVTQAGRDLYESMERSRETWLVRAIDATMDTRQRAVLAEAAGLLERLAEADLRPGVDFR
jgi:DNA-binding MarR family transcriptional regulator